MGGWVEKYYSYNDARILYKDMREGGNNPNKHFIYISNTSKLYVWDGYSQITTPSGNPKQRGWFEKDSTTGYNPTTDTTVVSGKDYYEPTNKVSFESSGWSVSNFNNLTHVTSPPSGTTAASGTSISYANITNSNAGGCIGKWAWHLRPHNRTANKAVVLEKWNNNAIYCVASTNGGTFSNENHWYEITSTTATKYYDSGTTFDYLPTVTRSGYIFDGWYTAETGGNKVTTSTIVNSNNSAIWGALAVTILYNFCFSKPFCWW